MLHGKNTGRQLQGAKTPYHFVSLSEHFLQNTFSVRFAADEGKVWWLCLCRFSASVDTAMLSITTL
jgi:hypothetical protein